MIEGLKDRTNSGRPPELSKKVSFQIKKEPSKSKQEWITKQIEELIVKKKDMKHHYIHIYRISFSKWGFKQKVSRKIHINTAVSREEKEDLKKSYPDTGGKAIRKHRIYGSITGRILLLWFICKKGVDKTRQKNRVRVTGSYKHKYFWSSKHEGLKQLFRQYDVFDGEINLCHFWRKYILNIQILFVYGQSVTTLQVKGGTKVFW